MPVVSPRLAEFLLKATGTKDVDNAFQKVFSEYLNLKSKNLQETIEGFHSKWGMNFDEFKNKLKAGTLEKNEYSFDVEQDFWRWEETETLLKHYESLIKEWI